MSIEQDGEENGQEKTPVEGAISEETASAPEMVEEEPAQIADAAPSEEVTVVDPEIPLEVFAQISGKRPDQIRGFTLWAKKQGFKRKTRPEWEAEWKRYLERPV